MNSKMGLEDADLQLSSKTKFDNEENCIFDIPLDFQLDQRGLGSFCFDNMKKHKHRVAQYDADTGEEEKYDQVLKRCIRTALHLKSKNLTKDDVIVLCSYNSRDSVIPFIASFFINIPVASLDPTLSLMDTVHLLKEVRPKILFIIPEFLEVVETSLEKAGLDAEIVVFGESKTYATFSTFLEPHEEEQNFIPKAVDSLKDTAVVLFSSGTTGLPKGIMINHYSLLVQGHNIVTTGNIGDVLLTYATLYWISSVIFQIAAIEIGTAKLLDKHFAPDKIWYLIDKYKVTHSFAAPSLAIAMLKAGRPDGIDTTSLWSVIIGGAAISEKQLWEFRDLLPGTFIFQAYGQTEVGGVITSFCTLNSKQALFLHYKTKSVGMIMPGMKVKVVNLETENICGPNEKGEIRVKSKCIMNGYYNRDSSESFDNDGWLKTGDIGYFDEDKCFYIVDRIKEMLKYKSWHIAPVVLEQVINSHPAVAQAVVIGIPHEEDGDHPMALIVVKSSEVSVDDIVQFVEEQVPDRMRLRGGVKLISSIPLTPSGKVKRKDLRTMVINGNI